MRRVIKMIEVDKIYTFEECAKLCGRTAYYFKSKAKNKELIALATDPKRPFMKAVYGRHLIRFLQKYKFGLRILEKFGDRPLPDEYFINEDIQCLEKELNHLYAAKEKRLRALYVTLIKIESIKTKIDQLHELYHYEEEK